jgi:hypothetical protein
MSIDRVQQCTICFMNVDGSNGYLCHIQQVFGNDHLFFASCLLCYPKFILSHFKSFIHHLRKHILHSSPNGEG